MKFLFIAFLASILVITHAQDNQTEFLDVHNTARAQVGVPPLKWNHTLALYAQNLANKVKQTCNSTMSSRGPYGENTASGYGAFTTVDAVNQ
uniref:SCP domain-containing protein n=1 Tax=Chenopodium quinoa TaxID=63459 RepID=A0A803LM29_CHEQI